MCMYITCSVDRYAQILAECTCAQKHSVPLQSDIGNYWPGLHQTVILVMSCIHVNWDCFEKIVCIQNFSET